MCADAVGDCCASRAWLYAKFAVDDLICGARGHSLLSLQNSLLIPCYAQKNSLLRRAGNFHASHGNSLSFGGVFSLFCPKSLLFSLPPGKPAAVPA